MNLLSAGGFAGAAIVSDELGRAIGYMGGNYDVETSQHRSYGYKFDSVIEATDRQITPIDTPVKVDNVVKRRQNQRSVNASIKKAKK